MLRNIKKTNHEKKRALSLKKFWTRFPARPNFKNASVLEVGCGTNSLSIDMILVGAKHVCCLDVNQKAIDFLRAAHKSTYPVFQDKIEYVCGELKERCVGKEFDYIVSKDTLEHVIGLEDFLAEIRTRLKANGKAYIGFGPLYKSCYGDHGRAKCFLPWGHLIIPERIILRRISKARKKPVMSMQELGLNKLSLKDYEHIFKNSGLSIEYFKANCGKHPAYKVGAFLGKIPLLREYLTFNLYCILEKKEVGDGKKI